ncbi:hypothetical protein PVOR_09864 [Paenibacillus vortex V453]|uniref:Uncharacterized protein n=1 Tax=Paenibacillus vortex V453 TaxID=715225 RepID=A0A2R9SXQ2_9BACL|nr:hypothetical protein [Paenibacillus vortex]EFU42162.1 hypothetical protein PVOR_09864 [Paenibacillus vortex V453]
MAIQTKDQKHDKYEPRPEALDHVLITGSLLLPYILIPLTIWRAVSNQHLNYRKGFTYKLISFQLLFSFVSYLIYGFFFNSIFAYIVGVFLINFVLLVVVAGFQLNRNERYSNMVEQYKQVIFIHKINHIEEIAEQMRQKPISVEKDLEYLMNKGHFPRGAIVDGELIFKRNDEVENFLDKQGQFTSIMDSVSPQRSIRTTNTLVDMQANPPQPKTVECSGCGSKVILNKMDTKECDYCGIVLH